MQPLDLFAEATKLAMEFAPKVILSIITLVIGFWIIGRIGHILENTLKKREIDTTIVPFIVSLVTVGLKVMLLVSVAGIIGIQTTSFVAVLGAMGLAVGLALQGSLGHFASGVLLLVFKPYKVGDLIKIGDHTGVVEEIQIFNTVLRTLDNKKVIIPNGVVTTGTIINISGQGEIRVDMTYSICEKEDIDRARRIVQQVADASPLILKNIPVDIFVNSFTPDGVEFAVRPWCKSEHFWDVYFYMQENIKKAFAREKVGAPIPNITVFNKPS